MSIAVGMDNKVLKQLIEKVFKTDERLWNEDKTEVADKKFAISKTRPKTNGGFL